VWVAGGVYLVLPWTRLNGMKPGIRQLAAARAFWETIAFVPTAASEPKLSGVTIKD